MLTTRFARVFPEFAYGPVLNGASCECGPQARPQASPQIVPVDVFDDEQAITIQAQLPGWNFKDLSITMLDNELTLAGERAEPEKTADRRVLRSERETHTSFSRKMRFQTPIEAEKVSAKLEQGILTITLPKAQAAKPRKIEIQPS